MAPKERVEAFRQWREAQERGVAAQERGVAAQDAVLQGSKHAKSAPLSRKP